MIMEPKQGINDNYFDFFIISFMLCYWYDKKTGIVFTDNYNLI